jgi:DNA-binding PadR family transcriptional regulator
MYRPAMLELTILGFLVKGPLHGYLLRQKIAGLAGHARPVSGGCLHPAVSRLVDRASSSSVRSEAQPGRDGRCC